MTTNESDMPEDAATSHPETLPQETSDTLSMALETFDVKVDSRAVPELERYCELLWDWNSKLNLTRHTDFDAFVTRDLIDTQHLIDQIPKGARVLDVGSGGGVPGIPAAILRPDLRISLADSVAKKAASLQSIVQTMNLKVAVQPDRAENVLKRKRFDVVTARAVAPAEKMLRWFEQRWDSIGELLLIKGRRWPDEEAAAAEAGLLDQLRVEIIDSWSTCGRDGNSVLVSISRIK